MVKICCVKHCKSEAYAGCGISFFGFPRNESLRQQWLEVVPFKGVFSNNSFICSRHFKSEDIIIHQVKTTLKSGAVPSIFPVEVPSDKRINILSNIILKPALQSSQMDMNIKSHLSDKHLQPIADIAEKENVEPTPGTSMEPPSKKARYDEMVKNLVSEKTKLQYKVKLLSQRLKRRNIKIKNLKSALNIIKKKCPNYEEVESVLMNNFSNIHKHINTKKSDKTVRYSDELKSFALTLYFYSPKAFRFLRNHMSLPHPSTLRRLLSTHDCNTGFMKEVLEFLKVSVAKNTFSKDVSLVFDAMSIRSQLTYDKNMDKYWGYVDYGGIVHNDSESLATEVLVVMIVSYKKKFKCPIGYFFINKISANIQAQLILTAIRLLADINITVRSITCDGTVTNIKTFELLGCNFSNTDVLKTCFKHPIKDISVHCFLDPPHMIKLARNVFAECNLQSDLGKIDFKYVRKLHELQEQEGLKLKNKISAVHVNFYGKKMNVKLAAQVLSSSVADAIEFLNKSGHKSFVGSEATVQFIRILDRIFDILNAKNPFGEGFKAPLRLRNKKFWMNAIVETKSYLRTLKVDQENILSHRRKTPALGLIIDCISITNLVTELLSDETNNMSYFLPYKCSQDHIEIFFSCVRASGASNDNPSALQFRYIMRKLLFRNSVQPSLSANIIADNNFQTCPVLEFKNPKRMISHGRPDEIDDNVDQLMEKVSTSAISEYKNNILYYIAGYIANNLSKKISCEHCIAALFKVKEQCDHDYAVDICKFSSFTTFIDRGKLKYVTKFVFNIVKYCEKVFMTMCLTSNLKDLNRSKMMLLVIQHFCTSENIYFEPPHPIQSFECEDSHEIVICKSIASSYFNLRLFSYTKSQNLKIIGDRSTMRQRLHKTILFNNV